MDRKFFLKLIAQRPYYLDGSYGAQFFKMGYTDIAAEMLNLSEPDTVLELQKKYVKAGSDILLTNTFSANRLKLRSLKIESHLAQINRKAVLIAKKAANCKALVFGDISSTGEFPEPVGVASSREIYDTFLEQARYLDESGVDGFIVETMTDLKELKLAILAIREVTQEKPLIAHMTFEKADLISEDDSRSVTGTPVGVFADLMDDLDVDVVGINCTLGPADMYDVFSILANHTKKPLSVEPNAGDPELVDGRLFYKMTPEGFGIYTADMVYKGASIIGGCCGTGPAHIRALKVIVDKNPEFTYFEGSARAKGEYDLKSENSLLSSRTKLIALQPFAPIGERINPASNKTFQEEIEDYKFDRMLKLAKEQEAEGSKILDLNFGIEKLLDHDHFAKAVIALDKISSLPISFDIQTGRFLESALFEYPGRPLINSAKVTDKSLEKKAGLLKKYGGMLILLAMGKSIPTTAIDRFKQVMRGVRSLEELGISKDRILADPLVLSLGADNDPSITLETVKLLHNEGIKTTMGLSNLSFGMPLRSSINAAFLSQAIYMGLDSAIMNTADKQVFNVMLGGLELRGEKFRKERLSSSENPLSMALLNGSLEQVNKIVDKELEVMEPLDVSQKLLGNSMNEIGELYSKKKIFLPHLILAAETSKPVFERLSQLSDKTIASIGKIVLATVEGDVHDIGKRIVGTVLSSAGFEIVDIGKDVPSAEIVQRVKEHKPDILGLSAMMTTTIGRVKEVSELLRTEGVEVLLIAGGASMNKRLSDEFGCHGYSSDASGALKICRSLLGLSE